MSCQISTWIIQPKHLNEVCDALFNTNIEKAGAILFNKKKMISSDVIFNSNGEKASVKIELKNNHMISFHTHPTDAYIDAKCVYGHPSGDDIREFTRLAGYGALNHGVFALEGFYLVQIHPKFIKYVMKQSKENIQHILNGLYLYFRDFHGQRSYSNVKKTNYTPRIFVEACNKFKLQDMNLPKTKFNPLKFPKKILSCVWFFSDNLIEYEKDYDSMWKIICSQKYKVSYSNRTYPICFIFFKLHKDDRNLNKIIDTLKHCVLSE